MKRCWCSLTLLLHLILSATQARKLLQRLPLQDMNGSRTWPMISASWPRHMPRNIPISRSSREIRACATTRRAPTRQPPDRPSRGEIFPRVRNHSAGMESLGISRFCMHFEWIGGSDSTTSGVYYTGSVTPAHRLI